MFELLFRIWDPHLSYDSEKCSGYQRGSHEQKRKEHLSEIRFIRHAWHCSKRSSRVRSRKTVVFRLFRGQFMCCWFSASRSFPWIPSTNQKSSETSWSSWRTSTSCQERILMFWNGNSFHSCTFKIFTWRWIMFRFDWRQALHLIWNVTFAVNFWI